MDELPESWRRTLREERAAAKKAPPRAPIQPLFALWPWGLLAAAAPLAAAYVAFMFSHALGCDFPGWPGALIFMPLLMLVNGALTARAISSSQNYMRFAGVSAVKGLLSFCAVLIPYASEAGLIFLGAYCLARLIGRLGFGGIVFTAIVVFAGCLMLPAVAVFFKATGLSVLPNAHESNIGLALALAVAYPLALALCTGALPAQPTFMGRVDAASSGISAALLGLFAGVVLYRTAGTALDVAAFFQQIDVGPLMQAGAAGCGLAGGNVVCVWLLFRTAYSERDAVKEIVAKPVDFDVLELRPRQIHYDAPASAPIENPAEFEDAT